MAAPARRRWTDLSFGVLLFRFAVLGIIAYFVVRTIV